MAGPVFSLLMGSAAICFPATGKLIPIEAASEERRNFLLLYILIGKLIYGTLLVSLTRA